MESMEAGRRSHRVEEEDAIVRGGTVWTATAHCITIVIGAGVLALAWSVSELGWIFGPVALLAFAALTYYTSNLLADCYRCPDPVNGTRNPNYMSAVRSYLGPKNVLACCIAQYTYLWGTMVGYTITSATSMRKIMQSEYRDFHGTKGSNTSGMTFMMIHGVISILLSLIPNMGEITWLSVLAALTSFGYSGIGLFLCVAKLISHGEVRGSLMGIMSSDNVSPASKTWNSFQALGNIAFAYTYAQVLVEIQDTLKSPPSENVTMKRAGLYGCSVITAFYVTIGCFGYAAFGNEAPGNLLTGFDKPFWLVDIANMFIVVHIVGASQDGLPMWLTEAPMWMPTWNMQLLFSIRWFNSLFPFNLVCAQPIFAFVEKIIACKLPESSFFHTIYIIRVPFTKAKYVTVKPTRIIWRSTFIGFTTLIAMLLPFFNAILGWLGPAGFWPLTVYFPVNMHITQRKIKRGTLKWYLLHGLCFVSLVVCVAAMAGSTIDIIDKLEKAKLFHMD